MEMISISYFVTNEMIIEISLILAFFIFGLRMVKWIDTPNN
jgi:hypothetical protein